MLNGFVSQNGPLRSQIQQSGKTSVDSLFRGNQLSNRWEPLVAGGVLVVGRGIGRVCRLPHPFGRPFIDLGSERGGMCRIQLSQFGHRTGKRRFEILQRFACGESRAENQRQEDRDQQRLRQRASEHGSDPWR
jgi:hypothetical protein